MNIGYAMYVLGPIRTTQDRFGCFWLDGGYARQVEIISAAIRRERQMDVLGFIGFVSGELDAGRVINVRIAREYLQCSVAKARNALLRYRDDYDLKYNYRLYGYERVER